MLSRRTFITTQAMLGALSGVPSYVRASLNRPDVVRKLRALERGQARLGVCFLNTVTGEIAGSRLEERFAMCSTFKLPLVAAFFREADNGKIDLNEEIAYSKRDLLPWAPVTGKHVREGKLSILKLAQAAQELSDGVAANLLVKRLGGPAQVTKKFAEMGDDISRLDRYEPDLGLVLSGDHRDTTSPLAMAQLVNRITTGSVLSALSRERLLKWMEDTGTGARRLRAGLPASWRTGNKTGTGRTEGTTNKCNDIAITFPPTKNPVIIAAFYDSGEYTAQVETRHEAVLAEVGKIAAQWATN
jgi:beta-lactamase class A